MTQYLSGFTNPNYYFNDYRLGPVVQWPQILGSLPNLASQGILTLDSGATHLASDASNFEYTERVSAAYAMNTVDFGRFRLQLGFRVEATQLDTLGYIVTNDSPMATGSPRLRLRRTIGTGILCPAHNCAIG